MTDTVGSTVTDRFFSGDWQLLETKTGSNTVTRNVWSPVYVDGLVLRDRDTDGNGSLDERLYALQDANWNTTALVNAGGTVQERYTYAPFGQVTFRDGSGSTLSGSAKDWVFLHQGGERIAAWDYEFRSRVYSPSLGRWLSNDPLGFGAGVSNFYAMESNNPLNKLDPSGLREHWDKIKDLPKYLEEQKAADERLRNPHPKPKPIEKLKDPFEITCDCSEGDRFFKYRFKVITSCQSGKTTYSCCYDACLKSGAVPIGNSAVCLEYKSIWEMLGYTSATQCGYSVIPRSDYLIWAGIIGGGLAVRPNFPMANMIGGALWRIDATIFGAGFAYCNIQVCQKWK